MRLFLPALFLTLISCSPATWYLHDRHVLSTPLLKGFAQEHSGTTLVLVDYHHDAGPLDGGVTSFNWAGRLVAEGLLSQVIWVSARDFGPGQRESRKQWLDKSLSTAPPEVAARILSRYRILDFQDFTRWLPEGPFVLSLDLDVFANDAGEDPQVFLEDLKKKVQSLQVPLATVALSAAYQPNPGQAWVWLEQWVSGLKGATIKLQVGPPAPQAESQEEAKAWARWREEPLVFRSAAQGSLWSGSGLWWGAPETVRQGLLRSGLLAGDEESRFVVAAWADTDHQRLASFVPARKLEAFLDRARQAVSLALGGSHPSPVSADPSADLGLAVRVMNRGIDRGCLAWYRGVKDAEPVIGWCAAQALRDPRYAPVRADESDNLEVEVSVFGPWADINSPEEFSPGYDSLLLIDGQEVTLLQASLAVERRYSRQEFLTRLSIKAGLGPEGWKDPRLHFRRSATLWALAPLIQEPADQKKLKK